MPKVRTPGELQDLLDRDFGWRLKEIASLKLGVRRASSFSEVTIIRAGVALLYAHWEGFVKAASLNYIEYVNSRGLKYDELQTCFATLGMKSHLETLVASGKAKGRIDALDFVKEEMSKPARLVAAGAINTDSNLSSIVFGNIVSTIAIDPVGYESKYNLIDESLLRRRNKIAHGEFLDLDAEEWRSLADEVLTLIRQFKTDVENAAALELFKVNLS